jgi:DNA-binding Lrp family transcriptional regulator
MSDSVMKMVMDKSIKEKILTILMSDSRKSFRAIAKELNISTTTVSRLVKELEDDGMIIGYTTLIDWQKLGYDSTLCLQVGITPGADTEKVGKALKAIPSVKQVFYTTGDMTFSAYAVCKNSEDAADILEKLRKIAGIERVVPHTILKTF